MDDPALSQPLHREALRGLSRIHRCSGTVRHLWPAIARYARQRRDPAQPIRLLDVACGGGDVLLGLWQRAQRSGIALEPHGCDISPLARQVATERAAQLGVKLNLFHHDIVAAPPPDSYDIILCTLFLHHLAPADGEVVLRRLATATKLLIVDDLVRSRWGLLLATWGTRVLSRSPVVHVDGPLSVRGALTPGELRELAARAGLAGATVHRHRPARMQLLWSRP